MREGDPIMETKVPKGGNDELVAEGANIRNNAWEEADRPKPEQRLPTGTERERVSEGRPGCLIVQISERHKFIREQVHLDGISAEQKECESAKHAIDGNSQPQSELCFSWAVNGTAQHC